jgi:hypothetical protein
MRLLRWIDDRKKQAGRAVDVVSRGASRTFDQVNGFDNGRTWQQRTPTNTRSVRGQAQQQAYNAVAGTGVRAVRSATGLLQAGSGLADLASPGTGTSRVSQGLDQFAKFTDAKAKSKGVNTAYQVTALPMELLGFGGLAKAGTKVVAKAPNIVQNGIKVADKFVDSKTANLIKKGGAGSVVGASIKSGAKLPNQLAEVGFTGKLIGEDASKGREITPQRVATDIALGAGANFGLPALGQAIKLGVRSTPGVKTTKAVKDSATKTATIAKKAADKDGLYNTAVSNRQLAEARLNATAGKMEIARQQNRNVAGLQKQTTSDRNALLKAKAAEKLAKSYRDTGAGMGTKAVNSGATNPQGNRNIQTVSPAAIQDGRIPTQELSSNGSIAPTELGMIEPTVQIPQLPVKQSGRNNLTSPKVNALTTLPEQSTLPKQPQIRGPERLLEQLQSSGITSANDTLNAPKMQPSRYASKTAPESDVVSAELAGSIQKNAPSYEVQTDKGRLASANQRITEQGPENFIKELDQRLDVENGKISSQDVTDTQSIAAMLDAAGDSNSLLKATALYDRLSEHLTAAGQTVQAASLIANRSPQGLKFQAQRQFKKNGVNLTADKIKELNGYIDAVRKAPPNSEAMAIARDNVQYFIAKNTPSNTADKIVNFWRSGLLTAPTTTFGALAGNSFAAVQRKLWTNPIATMTDMVFSLGTKTRTRALATPGAFAGGARRGLGNVAPAKDSQYWKTGYDPMNPIANEQTVGTNSRRINYGEGRLGRATGTYVNGVYKLMGAVDQPFRYGAYDEVMSSLARSEAINRGLKGDAQRMFVKDYIDNPPETAVQRATDEAMDATFQDPTALAGLVQSAKQGLRQKGYNKSAALVDFLIPFSGVPSSVASRVIRNTPIGTANQLVRQMINIKKGEGFDQRLMSQAIAEGSVGLPIVAAGFALAQTDNFNGGYPSDPKERQKWTDENRQENSVRIGNRWYSLNYIQPFGTLLAVGAGIAQAEGEDGENPKLNDYLSQATKSGVQSFAGQSYLEGVMAPLEAINNPEQEASRYVAGVASGAVPNFIRSATRASDTVQRDATGVTDGIKGAIPGLRQTLPAKIGSNGEPLPNKDNFVNMYVNPLKPSIVRDGNPVVQETSRLQENKLGVSAAPVKKIDFGDKTVKLDKQQQEAYNKKLGTLRNQEWSKLINSTEYKILDDVGKQKSLDKAAEDARAVVKRGFASDNAVGPYAQDFKGKDKGLTKAQQDLATGKTTASDYTAPRNSAITTVNTKIDAHSQKVLNEYNNIDEKKRKEKIENEPSYEWKVEKSKLANDIAEGKVKDLDLSDRKEKVEKLNLTKDYSKLARELYTRSEDKIEAYLDEFGDDKLADELLGLDQLAVDKGWRKKRKLYGTSASGTSKGRQSAKGTKGSGSKRTKTARGVGKAAKARKEATIPFDLISKAAKVPSIGRARQARISARAPGRPSFSKGGSKATRRMIPKAAKYQGSKLS